MKKTGKKVSDEGKLSAKETLKYQKLLADICSKKTEGFVFVVSTKEVENGKHLIAEGLTSGHNVGRKNTLQIVVDSLGLSSMDILDVILKR